jgi:peptide/nickel transport system substrate-binding protein
MIPEAVNTFIKEKIGMKAIGVFFLWFLPFGAFATEVAQELKIAIVQEWNQFNPVTVNLASTESFLPFVIRPMVTRNAHGDVIADLAEKIPSKKDKLIELVKSNGMSKVVAQWTIRANANWGDGLPVTCKDWWLGWQVGLSPNVSTEEKNIFEKIENIEWTEQKPKLCKVTYKNDDWTYDRDLPPLLPAHLEQAVFEKWKGQPQAYEQNSNFIKDPTNKGLYSGPYVVDEYALGSHFLLSRNKYFFGTTPKIERILVKHIGETSTLKSHLQTNEVNMISAVGLPPDLALTLDEDFQKSKAPSTVVFLDSPIFQGLFFNLDNEILKDLKVREALWKSIDKQELTKAFFQGKLKPAETFLAPQNPAFQAQSSQYSPSAARALLDEAGWKADGKGMRSKDGRPLILEFRTSAGIKILETIQTYICSQFQKVGAQCVVKNQPPRVFLGDSVPHGDFALAMFGQPVLPDTSLRGIFASTEIPSKENAWTGQNVFHLKNAQLDERLKSFDREWSSKKRLALIKEMENILLKEKPFVPIYHRREAVIMPKNLVGFQSDISGTGFLFPEKWSLKN